MPKILYVYQKQEQNIINIHVMQICLKYEVKKLLKDEFTGNPRWNQNAIDKVNMKIFVPVFALKRHSGVRFVMFPVNKYVKYCIHLTFCADKVKILK